MSKLLSIIIPSDKDYLLQKTIDSILENSVEEIEVIPVLDGHKQPITKDSRVKVVYLNNNRGTRGAINAGLEIAKGDYVAKIDSHCIIEKGFDKIMTDNCAEDWLLVPRRFSLDETNWKKDDTRPVRDYHFLTFPVKSKYGYGMFAQDMFTKSHHFRRKNSIDDLLTFQASCWLANAKYFKKHIGLLDDNLNTYGPYGGEYIEIGMKYWLGGGKVKLNKKTWYAHLSKRQYHYDKHLYSRKYKKQSNIAKCRTWSSKHWINNEEPNMVHKFNWLIEKFWPVKSWPENWQEIWDNYKL